MTRREILVAWNAINRRTHNNYAKQAALHNKKLPFIEDKGVENVASENTEAADRAMKAALERRKANGR